MKKVKDSLTLTQKSDLSRGIALKNAAEARRLGDRLKTYESHLHQQLVDIDAEIMDLRLSPLLRRKAPAGKLSPASINTRPHSGNHLPGSHDKTSSIYDNRSHTGLYPLRFTDKPNFSNDSRTLSGVSTMVNDGIITDLNNKKSIPLITVVQDAPSTEIQPGFLPKIRAISAGIVGHEQHQQRAEVEVRPQSVKLSKVTTVRSNSTETLPDSPTLELPHETFQRSRSFDDKDSFYHRPRTPIRRAKDLEQLLRPQQGVQTVQPLSTTDRKKELQERVKKFLNTPNPATDSKEKENLLVLTHSYETNEKDTKMEVNMTPSSDNTNQKILTRDKSIDGLSTKESPNGKANGDSSMPKNGNSSLLKNENSSLSANGNSSPLTSGNSSQQNNDGRLDKNEGVETDSVQESQERNKSRESNPKANNNSGKKLERKGTISQNEEKTGDREKSEPENTEDVSVDIQSATGIPALDKLLLARAIAEADNSRKDDFDEVLQRRLEALLKDPPTQEELRKIRYLRLPEDKIPDILASVFGNEDGSITSHSHGKLSLVENSEAAENAETNRLK